MTVGQRAGLLVLVVLITVPFASAQLASVATISDKACGGGFSDVYPCANIDLLSFVSKASLGAPEGSLNDIWGWTDPETGNEYALVGLSSGTAFVDVTNPLAPLFLGSLPTQTRHSSWRDIKVYEDHALIVSEAFSHGMQVFDLTRLRSVTVKPETFTATAVYSGIGSAHNIFVNEDTGFAYAVGSVDKTGSCGRGLHMIDVRSPERPTYAGCFTHSGTGRAGTGYTHDVQCVVYEGPDAEHRGQEMCFGSNETAISIADVTDKTAPVPISIFTYPLASSGGSYIHQGWLTEDHGYFIQNDELDERNGLVNRTVTRIWDIRDLEEPVLLTEYEGPTSAIDHNLYIWGSWLFMANYTSGLRVVDVADVSNPREIAFFDTVPGTDASAFAGAWSTFPFFKSGTVLISSIDEGLFVVRPPLNKTGTEEDEVPETPSSIRVYPNPVRRLARVDLTLGNVDDVAITVFDVLGRSVLELGPVRLSGGTGHRILDLGALPAGRYIVRATGASETVSKLITVVK